MNYISPNRIEVIVLKIYNSTNYNNNKQLNSATFYCNNTSFLDNLKKELFKVPFCLELKSNLDKDVVFCLR